MIQQSPSDLIQRGSKWENKIYPPKIGLGFIRVAHKYWKDNKFFILPLFLPSYFNFSADFHSPFNLI